MFCTNCGNKLPDNAKFCPSCGAPVPENRAEEVLQTADAAAEAVPVMAEAAAETLLPAAEDVTETAEKAVAEVLETAEEVAEEAADTVAEAAQAAEETAAEAVSGVIESAETVTEEVTDAVSEAVVTADEAVSETVQETVEAAESAAGELTDAVTETAEDTQEAVREMTETAEAAAEQVPEEIAEAAEAAAAPVFDSIPQEVPAEEPAPAEPYSAPEMPPVQPQEPAPFSPYAHSGSAPAAETPVNPYTSAAAAPPQPEKSGGKKKGKGILAALLAVVLIAGLFLVYWNLPNTKFGRYTKQAAEAYGNGDYDTATDLYNKALEIHPDDIDTQNALVDMYNEVQDEAVGALEEMRYEDAIAGVHLMQKISPSDAENNEYAMFDIFYTWIYDEAEKGNFDALQSILDRAGTELTPEYSEELNIDVANIREKISLEEQFRTAASAILDCNANKDFKGVYDQIEGILDSMKRYTDLGGELPYVLTDSEKSGVELNYDAGRDAAQAYIGGLIDGYLKSGQADTYYIEKVSSSPSYEYFTADGWFAGRPNGNFTEITFNGEPGTPTTENCAEVSGVIKDGKYDGEITNRRSSGSTFYMQFDRGTVKVLDTVDPNGDPGNVVGYTSDKNSWITFKDSGLTGSYGVRYIP